MKPDYKLVAKRPNTSTTPPTLPANCGTRSTSATTPQKQLDTLVESADAIEADIDNDVNYLVFLGQVHRLLRVEDGEHRPAPDAPVPQAGIRAKPSAGTSCRPVSGWPRARAKAGRWCTIHAKALPVQQFFKALRYRELRPAEQENAPVPRNELVQSTP